MTTLYVRLQTLRHEDGQTMAEYGVVLSLITIALLASFGLLAEDIEATVDRARAALAG